MTGILYSEMCNGLPVHPDYGTVHPCPLRTGCVRYTLGARQLTVHRGKFSSPPYDFDDLECARYEDSEENLKR